MKESYIKTRCCKAVTLLELVIAMAMLTIIFAVVVPQFAVIRNSWDIKQSSAEMLQNGRVLMTHMKRNLSKAVRITAVSDSSDPDGYIEFENNDGNTVRYDIAGNNYVEYGVVGNLFDLAGPVSSLVFTCYDICDLSTPITNPADVRVVKINATVTNSALSARSMSFTTEVYLRVNSQAASELPEELVGWWKMNETSGTTATDCSCGGNDGTLVNMSSPACWITGQIEGALDLDGGNDYVNSGSDGSLDITGDITVALWLRADSYSNEPDITTKGAYNVSYSVWLNSSGRIVFALNNNRLTSSLALSTGTWYHVAVTRSGSTRKIYINGQEDNSDTYGTAIGTTSSPFTISTNSYPFNGAVDDVRVYNRALNDEEVAELAETLRYRDFNEAKTSSGVTLTIDTPPTNTGDLLIAAVATDGDTSSTLSPPSGWTEIDVEDYSSAVTLGVWWRIAAASEPATHQFSWTGARPAYGWIMRFTGQDSTHPINAWSAGNQTSINPTSPAVTATVNGCIILRLGAFDGSDITVDSPGLSGHTAITMDLIGVALFQDGFETDFSKWTDGGATDWDRTTGRKYSGSYSAHCGSSQNDLVSDNIDTSSYSSFLIEFWYYVHGIDNSDNVYLQLYNGSSYVDYFEVGNQPENNWYQYQATINASQYMRTNFRIKFEGSSIDNNEDLWIDDVLITAGGVSGGAGYVMQSSAGSSGTSTFALTAPQEARMLTIAIAPAANSSADCCGDYIRP
jgi:type II secretory pathway pseudopilin PulG